MILLYKEFTQIDEKNIKTQNRYRGKGPTYLPRRNANDKSTYDRIILPHNKMQMEISRRHHFPYQINKDSKMVQKRCSEIECYV